MSGGRASRNVVLSTWGGEKLVSIEERYHHPDWAPETQKLALERRDVALKVKAEIEGLIGSSLEEVIRSADNRREKS